MKKLIALIALTLSTSVNALTYDCTFDKAVNIEGINKSFLIPKMTFIDDGENSYMVGNIGSSKLHKVDGLNQTSFIEVVGTGALMTATIVNGEIGDTVQVVYSRHPVFPNFETKPVSYDILGSQSYGTCKIQY